MTSAFTSPLRALGGLTDGLGKLGLAGLGVQAVTSSVKGLGEAMGVGLVNEMEQVSASINAFTKDGDATKRILAEIRTEANQTPFAFKELATATSALLPAAKQAQVPYMELIKQAEVLAASNPFQGLEGASFALREAISGDFTSIIERFNLSRTTINRLKDQGVPALEIVRQAMAEMGFDSDLVAAKAQTLEGRWSTFLDTIDTVKMTIAQPIFDVMKESLTGLQGIFDENIDTIQSFAQIVAANLTVAIQVLKDVVITVVQVFRNDWVPGVNEAGESINPIVELAGRLAVVFRDVLIPVIRTLVEWLGEHIPPVIDWLTQTGWPAVIAVGDAVRLKIGEITQFFQDLVSQMREIGVFTDLETIWKDLGDVAGILGKNLREDVNPNFAELTSKGPSTAQVIGIIAKEIKDTTQNVKDVVTAIKDFVTWLDNAKNTAWNLSQVLSGFTGGNVLEGLRALGRLMGRDFSLSVGQGMREAAPALQAASVSQAMQVPSAWRDAWEMHSPSQVAIDIGFEFASSLAMGISKGDNAVAQSVLAITKNAIRNNIDPLIALALAKAESNFNAAAVGDRGASVGLFQLHERGQGAGMGASRADPWVNAQKFLVAHGELFQQLKATGLAGEELAATFGRLAEVSDPQFAHRYAEAYRELVAQFGNASVAMTQFGETQQQGTTWAQQMAQEEAALAQVLAQQAPPLRLTADAMEEFGSLLGPIMRRVAAGTMTVGELDTTLIDLARAVGLTDKPFQELTSDTVDHQTAMEHLIRIVSDAGPQFDDLRHYIDTAGASSNEASLRFLQMAANFVRSGGNVEKAAEALGRAIPTQMGRGVRDASGRFSSAIRDMGRQAMRAFERGDMGEILDIFNVHMPDLHFAQGGVVPGPIGAPQLAVVHGGETVIPAGQMAGGIQVNIVVQGSVTTENDLVDAVRQGIIKTARRNGYSALGGLA